MPPDISVIIPLYNKAAEIERCLHSVLKQTMPDFEIVVVNDGSTDGSPDLVRGFSDPRLRIVDQKNGGLAAARNRGAVEAHGNLLVLIDADDEWLPTHLENVAGLYEREPEAGLFFTAYWVDKGGGWRRQIKLPSRYSVPGRSRLQDYFSIPDGKVLPSSSAVRKDALLAVQGYRKMFGEDIDLLLRIASFYPIAYSGNATAIWHLDAQNRMCVVEEEKVALYEPGALLSSLQFVETHATDPQTVSTARRYVMLRERKAILSTLLSGDHTHASRLYAWWRHRFEVEDKQLDLLLRLPVFVLRWIAKATSMNSKAQSSVGYALDRRASQRLFIS